MCGTCGCGESDVRVEVLADGHRHDGGTGHPHAHAPLPGVVGIETALLAKNDHLAAHNRTWLAERGIVALNLMSSPGSGKTSLLERSIAKDRGRRTWFVVQGDQATAHDAERVRKQRQWQHHYVFRLVADAAWAESDVALEPEYETAFGRVRHLPPVSVTPAQVAAALRD